MRRTAIALLFVGGCTFFTSDAPSAAELEGPSTELRPIRPAPPAEAVEARPPAELRPTPPIPPPAPPPTGPPEDTISARHILIQYQGSTRASADITRSRDEARAEAVRIARLAKAPGADFGALAREHSDGPTGPRGGDLGAFPRGPMHPAFESAAFDLEVDEVSDVVETPFGFHVIQRYR
jgi:hypothetical protein